MKNMITLLSVFIILNILIPGIYAQGPKGKDFGIGLVLGDPSGLSIKYWTTAENAFHVYIGSSYFGKIRLGADYLWHFDSFNSSVVKLYTGLGLVLGFGNGSGIWYKSNKDNFYYWSDNTVGIAARGVLGLNIIPRNSPLEIFLELAPLVGLSPNYGINIDAAVGIRFYP